MIVLTIGNQDQLDTQPRNLKRRELNKRLKLQYY